MQYTRKSVNLGSKTSQDIGFHHNSKLYINESLTVGFRAILSKVVAKKDEDWSETHIFATMKEFEEFNNKFVCQSNGGSRFR